MFSSTAASGDRDLDEKESSQSNVPNDVVLYQYEACPFCNKVGAFLEYYDIPYKIVEVNPINKKEIKCSDYRKVPTLMVDGEQMVNSSDIIDKMFQRMHPDSVSKDEETQKWRRGLTGERTVKRLRLSKALTAPETTSIYEACRRMAARKVDALLVTDSRSLLCGILTDKDIATKVIAREIDFENTPVSKVMSRNPVFVLADTLDVEALQKMVHGKFRHLPVVEHGQVIALLDIEKCLYDAIARMERAAEKGKAIAAAVEGVERHWGSSISGSNTFVESLRERMFRPSLSTIISENPKVVTVSLSNTVVTATKKMLEGRMRSVVVTVDKKPVGILTSNDILMRVIAQDLRPELILVEKVMTPNPECATLDTPILNALHNMHDGKYLHLPVVDKEGAVVAIVDVLHITHAAVTTVGNIAGIDNEAASSMMQKFWDSAMATSPVGEDDELRSESSFRFINDAESVKLLPYPSSNYLIHSLSKSKISRAGCIDLFVGLLHLILLR